MSFSQTELADFAANLFVNYDEGFEGDTPLTDEIIARVEEELGYSLPIDYIALMRLKNGGSLKRYFFVIPIRMDMNANLWFVVYMELVLRIIMPCAVKWAVVFWKILKITHYRILAFTLPKKIADTDFLRWIIAT